MNKQNTFFADSLRNELVRRDFHFGEKKISSGVRFVMDIACQKIPSITLYYIVRPNGQVTIQSYLANDIPVSKRASMLRIANEITARQRFNKYYIDPDGDFCLELEAILYEADPEQIGKHMFRMIMLASELADSAMPQILTELWKEGDCEEEDSNSSLLQSLLDTLSEDETPDESES